MISRTASLSRRRGLIAKHFLQGCLDFCQSEWLTDVNPLTLVRRFDRIWIFADDDHLNSAGQLPRVAQLERFGDPWHDRLNDGCIKATVWVTQKPRRGLGIDGNLDGVALRFEVAFQHVADFR